MEQKQSMVFDNNQFCDSKKITNSCHCVVRKWFCYDLKYDSFASQTNFSWHTVQRGHDEDISAVQL